MSDEMWRRREREQRDPAEEFGGPLFPDDGPRRPPPIVPTTPASAGCASVPTTPGRCRTGPIRRPARSRAWRRPPRPTTTRPTTTSTSGRRSPPSRRSGATTSPTTRPAIPRGGFDRDLTGEVRADALSEPLSRPPTGEIPLAPPRREPGRITIGTDPSGVPRRPPAGHAAARGAAAQTRSGPPGRSGPHVRRSRPRRRATCPAAIGAGLVLGRPLHRRSRCGARSA